MESNSTAILIKIKLRHNLGGSSRSDFVQSVFVEDDMDIEFRKFTDYNRGIMYEILKDAYSFDERCAICWDENWKQSDAFFFDNPDIADKYGFITCYKGEPIGFICWDPRNRPEYVEIGHNGIKTKYKGKGFLLSQRAGWQTGIS